MSHPREEISRVESVSFPPNVSANERTSVPPFHPPPRRLQVHVIFIRRERAARSRKIEGRYNPGEKIRRYIRPARPEAFFHSISTKDRGGGARGPGGGNKAAREKERRKEREHCYPSGVASAGVGTGWEIICTHGREPVHP